MTTAIEIDVWEGDIGELEVDAVVIPTAETLFMTSGPTAASVRRRAGEPVEREAVARGPVPAGSAIVTHGGGLVAPYLIHAVTMGHERRADADQLRAAIRSVLAHAAPLDLRRIATGLLGAEFGVFPPEEAAVILVEELVHGETGPIESVVIGTTAGETAAANRAVERVRSST